MAGPITGPLLELMADVMVAQPGSTNNMGEWVASGSTLSIPCYISGKTRLIRSPSTGREIVSSVKVICGEINNLDPDGHRFDLPSKYSPNSELTAISISIANDENGAHHEVVMFP